jgi:hypothetical protein
MSDKQLPPKTPEDTKKEEDKLAENVSSSASDVDVGGPLDEESSDPDIDSSDGICTLYVLLHLEATIAKLGPAS